MDNSELLSHYLVIMTTEKGPKGPHGFICENCDFKCYKKSKYERHLGTAKHKKQHLTTVEQQKKLECICGKKYKERTALYRHKQKCNYKTPEQIKEEQFIQYIEEQREEQKRRDEEQREEQKRRDEEQREEQIKEERLIQYIEEMNEKQKRRDEEQKNHFEEQKKQNEELKEQISGMSLVTNNNTINNTFNLKMFLNNDCKDAMGLDQFLRSIEVTDEDLKTFEVKGYVEAMTSLIERHLNNLAITERPIHCTDKKRQTIYFKSDKEGWKKDKEKEKIRYMINYIENESYYRFEDIYLEIGKHEDLGDPDAPHHKWYIRMGHQTTGGEDGQKEININKLSHVLTNIVYKSSKV